MSGYGRQAIHPTLGCATNSARLRWLLWILVLIGALVLGGCGGPGRVAVILDNSASMGEIQKTGTSFSEIKQTLLSTLALIPRGNEVGLRVFGLTGGSLKVADYSRDLGPLRRRLATIQPSGGTYIGEGLQDAARDLAGYTAGKTELFLITDGLGTEADVDAARKARNEILAGRTDFECTFILFNADPEVLERSSTRRAADAMGCRFDAPGALSASTLMSALTSAFTLSFHWIWLLLSAILYIVLVALTASMVFESHIANGGAPRAAMIWASVFLIAMWAIVVAVHAAGLFVRIGIGVIAVLAGLAIAATLGSAFVNSRKRKNPDDSLEDPFA